MIKKIVSVLLVMLATVGATAQTEQELKDLAMAQAQLTCQATVDEDYETVLKFTLPAVIELLGGMDMALITVGDMMSSMSENGTTVVSSKATELVAFGQEEGEYRCVIQNKIDIKTPGGIIKATNYIVGIFDQDASQWHFIEAAQLKNPQMKAMVLPDFETKLNIPENTQEIVKE